MRRIERMCKSVTECNSTTYHSLFFSHITFILTTSISVITLISYNSFSLITCNTSYNSYFIFYIYIIIIFILLYIIYYIITIIFVLHTAIKFFLLFININNTNMIFIILYDTTSINIFNMENTNNTTTYEHTLGKYVVGLDALHQGRESNWIRKTLKRLSVNDKDKQNKIVETMLKGLRTKEHISLELYTK